MIVPNLATNVVIPVNDNLIGTSSSLNTNSPSNSEVLPIYETIDTIPVITPGDGSIFPSDPTQLPKIKTLDELLNYLSEVMIRFNSNPNYYMQDDFALLIKTITNSLIYLYTSGNGLVGVKGTPFMGIATLTTNPGTDAINAGNQNPGIYFAQDSGTYTNFNNTVISSIDRLNSVVLLVPIIVDEVWTGYEARVYAIDVSNKSNTNHNHNLNDLTEKSYNSLTDKPDYSSTYEPKNSNIQTHIGDATIHVTTGDKST